MTSPTVGVRTERAEALAQQPSDAPPRRRRAKRGSTDIFYRYSVVWVLLVEIAFFSVMRPDSFFTLANAQSIMGSQSLLLLVSLGLTIPLAVGEFDLSIGAVVGFSQVIFATFAVNHGWPLLVAVAATLAICGLVGLINAMLVVRLQVGAFIATLAMGTLLTGLAVKLTSSGPIVGIPTTLVDVATKTFLGIELVFWYGLIAAIVLWYVLTQTPMGRRLYFVGANREAARLNGVATGRMRGGALIASALFAATAGILYCGAYGAADPTTADVQFMMPAFAAAFLGATAFRPGNFNAWGTFVAVYLVVTGIVGLSLLTNQVGWIADAFNGGILLLAVAAQRIVAMRRDRATTG